MTHVFGHQPVMVEEVIKGLAPLSGGCYIDATFGRGGHSRQILERIGDSGRLYVVDRDPEAYGIAEEWSREDPRIKAFHAPFSELGKIAEKEGLWGRCQGILLDLGVSSGQIDDEKRGFSFMRSGPLDMRMDYSQGQPLSAWLATADEEEIRQVLWTYGEERQARKIAAAIVRQRIDAPLMTTQALTDVVVGAVGSAHKGKHPATRTFQALRILINDELGELRTGLEQTLHILASGGRLAVISFHSLEDRMVKRFLREPIGPAKPRKLPVPGDNRADKYWRLIGKPMHASNSEQHANRRSRSAVLRIAEKI